MPEGCSRASGGTFFTHTGPFAGPKGSYINSYQGDRSEEGVRPVVVVAVLVA